MLDVILLAVGLSMDALAVSIGLGAVHRIGQLKVAFLAALYFGIAQGLMPLIGFTIGQSVLGWLAGYANWIAFFILLMIGFKMIFEAFQTDEKEREGKTLSQRLFLGLAIATSIDALAAGFSLNVFTLPAIVICSLIMLVTAIFSFIGVYIGCISGEKYQFKAEIFGGMVLIGIGLKLLVY